MSKKYCKLHRPLVLCALLFVFGWMSLAQGALQNTSLTVNYTYDEEPIEGVEVELFLVASYVNGDFTITEEFEGLEVDFETLSTPSAWREEGELVDEFIHQEDCCCEACQNTDDGGVTTFTGLEYGVYYVDIADVSYEEGTLISDPVLVTLPSYDNATYSYTYDVTMEPKVAYIMEPYTPDKPFNFTDEEEPEEPEVTEETEEPEEQEVLEEPEVQEILEESEILEVPEEPEKIDDLDVPEISEVPDSIDDYDEEIPQTGTYQWLVAPLAGIGILLLLLGILGIPPKVNCHEK